MFFVVSSCLDSANFERCLELWLHALSLKERSGACVVRDLLRFAQVFCQMLHVGVQVSVDVLITVMRTTVTHLEQLAEKVLKGQLSGTSAVDAIKLKNRNRQCSNP